MKKDVEMKVNINLKSVDNNTGEILQEVNVHNIVVTTGKSAVAQLINGLSTSPFTHIAIGTDNTSAVLGDTELGVEVARESATVTEPVSGTAKWEKVFTFGSGESYTITEIGLFNSATASGSIMLNRSVFTGIAVDADTDLTASITLAVDNA